MSRKRTPPPRKNPSTIGGEETVQLKDVHMRMKEVISNYNAISQIEFDDILNFHVQFERIHPFQDGNDRVGRLVMFWQCLRSGIVPFIITEDLHLFYYRGIQN